MASVRVSLTMVAASSVFAPGCMPSQAAAAAVTEDVSLTAVPAKMPKPSLVRPSMPPSVGKMSAAITLNRKMTEIACATSSSSARITGAVAAMAEPPQMEEPTPMSVAIFPGTFMTRHITNATMSEVAMVEAIMGRLVAPTFAIWARLRPKPRKTTAACRMYFEVNLTPGCSAAVSRPRSATASSMPMRMPKTGPPTTSSCWPSSQATTLMARHRAMPLGFSVMLDKTSLLSSGVLLAARFRACAAGQRV